MINTANLQLILYHFVIYTEMTITITYVHVCFKIYNNYNKTVTVTKLEYFYQFPIEYCFMQGLANCMNRPVRVVLMGTMVIGFCMGVLGIVFLWLCLRSVDRIECLFLVCGVVSTCISPC